MTLVFVYNAEEGMRHAIMDSLHKTFSPQTYACNLCAITYGPFRMDRQWRDWLQTLNMPMRFFHRSDFRAAWPQSDFALPAVLIEIDGSLVSLLTPQDFATIRSVDTLIAALEQKLTQHSTKRA
jgi:hypothetical protein